MHLSKKLAATALLAGGLVLGQQAVASDKTFYFNYSHMPVFLTDSANGDVYGNSFEFGVYIDDNLRAGVYHEELSGDVNLNIRGISTEYTVLGQDSFAASTGFMIGNDDNGLVADIYGRFTLLASDNANLNTRLAYRAAPDSAPAGGGDDLNGIALSVGFGLSF